MKRYQSTKQVFATQYETGVHLPNSAQVEMPAVEQPVGTFPAHCLIVIKGEYRIVFPGDFVLYSEANGFPFGIGRGRITDYAEIVE